MANSTEISWTDATFNPVWGCSKVSPACDNCYAERDSKRFAAGKVLWGVGTERRQFGDKHWNEPVRWNAKAQREGRRLRVFCASMADVFDKDWPDGVRERLWSMIEVTPHLDWLLLTKRIGNAQRMLPDAWLGVDDWPAHVRIGITVIDQEEYDRDVSKLIAFGCPNFLSIEPMLGAIDLSSRGSGMHQHALGDLIDWVICGGESGPHARPMHPDWARSLRDQCAAAGVPFHFKQNGEWAPGTTFADAIPSSEYCDFDGALKTDDDRVWRVGKKAAGWLLDGIEHKAFP